MKISVCGKGGSGKSTFTALLSREASNRGFNVLVVDSDESNTMLYKMLGFDSIPEPLMELVGGKKSIARKILAPAGLQFLKNKISVDEIPSENIAGKDRLKLVVIGKILQSSEGCACPMGALTKEFLRKLELGGKDLAVVDMEAGIEHFGRGIEDYVDCVVIVVEPSFESVNLAEKIKNLAENAKVKKISVVLNLNKPISGNFESKLKSAVLERKLDLIGVISFDEEILNFGLISEEFPVKSKASEEIKKILDKIQ